MNDAPRDNLSAMGQSRREAMLDELVESMGTLHRRRRARRRVGTAVGLSTAVLALVVFGGPSIFRNEPSQVVGLRPDPPDELDSFETDAPPRSARIEIIRTRPEIVAQYASLRRTPTHVQYVSPNHASAIEIIGDRRLLQVLAQMDRPAGLVRSDGKVWLTAAVTDAELESARPADGIGSQS